MRYTQVDIEMAYRLTLKAGDLTIESCMKLHDHLNQFNETQQWEIVQKVANIIREERGEKA